MVFPIPFASHRPNLFDTPSPSASREATPPPTPILDGWDSLCGHGDAAVPISPQAARRFGPVGISAKWVGTLHAADMAPSHKALLLAMLNAFKHEEREDAIQADFGSRDQLHCGFGHDGKYYGAQCMLKTAAHPQQSRVTQILIRHDGTPVLRQRDPDLWPACMRAEGPILLSAGVVPQGGAWIARDWIEARLPMLASTQRALLLAMLDQFNSGAFMQSPQNEQVVGCQFEHEGTNYRAGCHVGADGSVSEIRIDDHDRKQRMLFIAQARSRGALASPRERMPMQSGSLSPLGKRRLSPSAPEPDARTRRPDAPACVDIPAPAAPSARQLEKAPARRSSPSGAPDADMDFELEFEYDSEASLDESDSDAPAGPSTSSRRERSDSTAHPASGSAARDAAARLQLAPKRYINHHIDRIERRIAELHEPANQKIANATLAEYINKPECHGTKPETLNGRSAIGLDVLLRFLKTVEAKAQACGQTSGEWLNGVFAPVLEPLEAEVRLAPDPETCAKCIDALPIDSMRVISSTIHTKRAIKELTGVDLSCTNANAPQNAPAEPDNPMPSGLKFAGLRRRYAAIQLAENQAAIATFGNSLKRLGDDANNRAYDNLSHALLLIENLEGTNSSASGRPPQVARAWFMDLLCGALGTKDETKLPSSPILDREQKKKAREAMQRELAKRGMSMATFHQTLPFIRSMTEIDLKLN